MVLKIIPYLYYDNGMLGIADTDDFFGSNMASQLIKMYQENV